MAAVEPILVKTKVHKRATHHEGPLVGTTGGEMFQTRQERASPAARPRVTVPRSASTQGQMIRTTFTCYNKSLLCSLTLRTDPPRSAAQARGGPLQARAVGR